MSVNVKANTKANATARVGGDASVRADPNNPIKDPNNPIEGGGMLYSRSEAMLLQQYQGKIKGSRQKKPIPKANARSRPPGIAGGCRDSHAHAKTGMTSETGVRAEKGLFGREKDVSSSKSGSFGGNDFIYDRNGKLNPKYLPLFTEKKGKGGRKEDRRKKGKAKAKARGKSMALKRKSARRLERIAHAEQEIQGGGLAEAEEQLWRKYLTEATEADLID